MRATSRVACRTVLLDNSVTEAKMVPMQRRETDMMEEKVTNWGTLFILSIETRFDEKRHNRLHLDMMGLERA